MSIVPAESWGKTFPLLNTIASVSRLAAQQMRRSSSSSSRRPPPPTSQLQQIRQSSFMFGVQPAPPFRDEGGGERGGRKGEGGVGGKWGSIFFFFEASRRHALSQLGPYCAIFEAILKYMGPSWSPLGANASHPTSRTPCGCCWAASTPTTTNATICSRAAGTRESPGTRTPDRPRTLDRPRNLDGQHGCRVF